VYKKNRAGLAPWVILALLMWAAIGAAAWFGGNEVARMDAAATATAQALVTVVPPWSPAK
jgi:hypothetical protein